MQNFNKSFSGLVFIVAGISQLLNTINLVDVELSLIYTYLFIIYGFVLVAVNLGKDSPGIVFLGTNSFLLGTFLFVTKYFEIIRPYRIPNYSLFFAIGSGFILLFLDNLSEYRFLWIALICYSIFGVTSIYYEEWSVLFWTGRFENILYDYWPVFLILGGLGVFSDN